MDEQKTPNSADGGKPANSAEALAAEALKAVQQAVSSLSTNAPAAPAASAKPSAAQGEADAALAAAMAAINQAKSVNAVPAAAPAAPSAAGSPTPLSMPNFGANIPAKVPEGMDLLADVNLQVKIELGRTRMLVEDVLRLGEGSVVELDKLAGDPVDVYVNDRHVAKGEVLVLNDNFCVRINEIVAQVHTPA